MFEAFQVLTVLLVAVSMTMTLAHALELPGKLRLTQEAYLQVQPIYYPGFTIGAAVGEAGGILATIILVLITPRSSPAFALTLGALFALLAMHATYWLVTHPVNNFWLRDTELKGAGQRFFAFDPLQRSAKAGELDWTQLRDRWEYSHVVRAVLNVAALVLLLSALVA